MYVYIIWYLRILYYIILYYIILWHIICILIIYISLPLSLSFTILGHQPYYTPIRRSSSFWWTWAHFSHPLACNSFVCSIMKSKVTANAEIVGWTWRQLFDIIWSASPLSTARCDATLCHFAKCQERRDTEQRPGILAVRPEGPLFYANIERLEAQQKYLCVAEPMWANVSHVGTCKYDKIYEDQISSFFAMSC